ERLASSLTRRGCATWRGRGSRSTAAIGTSRWPTASSIMKEAKRWSSPLCRRRCWRSPRATSPRRASAGTHLTTGLQPLAPPWVRPNHLARLAPLTYPSDGGQVVHEIRVRLDGAGTGDLVFVTTFQLREAHDLVIDPGVGPTARTVVLPVDGALVTRDEPAPTGFGQEVEHGYPSGLDAMPR